jgi:hypothetical protein
MQISGAPIERRLIGALALGCQPAGETMTQAKTHRKRSARTRKWSSAVTRNSNALDLAGGVFRRSDPDAIARSLKRSAERSKRRKSSPYRSAMSMLTFYINRAGRSMSARRRRILEAAKGRLRELYAK